MSGQAAPAPDALALGCPVQDGTLTDLNEEDDMRSLLISALFMMIAAVAGFLLYRRQQPGK